MKKQLIYACLSLLLLTSCSPNFFSTLRSSNMNKLELGMSKDQVTEVLGNSYTIAEKRVENGSVIEVLSYRNSPDDDEFYLFVLRNNKLEEWYRELLPQFEYRKD